MLHLQRLQVLEKRLLIFLRVLADSHARRRRVANDLVVHVGDVHDVAHLGAQQPQRPPQHIHLQKRPEIPDVPVVVDRRPARIHPQSLAVRGRQRFHLPRQRVVKVHRRQLQDARIVAPCFRFSGQGVGCDVQGHETSPILPAQTKLRTRRSLSVPRSQQRRLCCQPLRRKLPGHKFRPRRRRDHRRVVRRQRQRWKRNAANAAPPPPL